jgi:hypothetical protein
VHSSNSATIRISSARIADILEGRPTANGKLHEFARAIPVGRIDIVPRRHDMASIPDPDTVAAVFRPNPDVIKRDIERRQRVICEEIIEKQDDALQPRES